MVHPLKIYSIYSISINNIKIDYKEIPQDLHNLVNDFIKFFKSDIIQPHINNFITKFNEKKNDLLDLSVWTESLEAVKYIIQRGGDSHKKNYDNVMEDLAECNYLYIIKCLIENDAIYNFKDIAYYSIYHNDLTMLKWLYIQQANLNNYDRDSLLEYAAQYNSIDIAKYLVEECNANIINTKLPFGKTKSNAIIHAANNGNYDILKYLVNKINIVATSFDEQN